MSIGETFSGLGRGLWNMATGNKAGPGSTEKFYKAYKKRAAEKAAPGIAAADAAQARMDAAKRIQGLDEQFVQSMDAIPGAAQTEVAEGTALALNRQALLSGTAGLSGMRGQGVRGTKALAKAKFDVATGRLTAAKGKQAEATEKYRNVFQALQDAKQAGNLTKQGVRDIAAMAAGDTAAEALVANWEARASSKPKPPPTLIGDITTGIKYVTGAG